MLLLGAERNGRRLVRARRRRPGEEVDVDAADAIGPELDITGAGARVAVSAGVSTSTGSVNVIIGLELTGIVVGVTVVVVGVTVVVVGVTVVSTGMGAVDVSVGI